MLLLPIALLQAWSESAVRAVFSRHDTAGGGFIALTDLKPALSDLGITAASQVSQLESSMDADGLGIVLWDRFFDCVLPFLRKLAQYVVTIVCLSFRLVSQSMSMRFTTWL